MHTKSPILILGVFLGVLGMFSVNVFLPALPTMIRYFHSDPHTIKLSITVFLIGFSVSQFFWGSLSERIGRKKPILWGLFISCIGSFLSMSATTVSTFIIGRLIEGAGIGCASGLCRTVLTDAFEGVALTRAISYLTTFVNASPAIAPIIGGYLLLWFGWRSIFLFLLFTGAAAFYLFFRALPETHKNIHSNITIKESVEDYFAVLTHRKFIGYISPYIFMSGGMIGYYAAGPFIFVSALHMSPHHYGFIQLITVASFIVGANTCRPITRKLGIDKGLILGVSIGLLSAVCSVLFSIFSTLTFVSALLPMTIFCFAAGLISPNGNAGAMSALTGKSGASGAVIGAMLYAFSALFSGILTTQNLNHLLPLTVYMCVISVLAAGVFAKLVLHSRK